MKTFFLLSIFSFVIPSVYFTDIKPVDENGSVTFTVKNFGINTNGELKGLKGNIHWDEANISKSTIDVSVDVATINTGIEMRDKDLQSEGYFNAAKYPQIQFKSTSISASTVTGILTMKGISKSLSFPYTVQKVNGVYVFEGNFAINRKDFGLGGSLTTISNRVDVHLKVKAK
ncbi:MAG: YceI family protein [Bacteroidetes bacterium]|nr:YceI family protein [Bacteroidota bacterium]